MKYINKEFNFSLELPEGWRVIDDKQFFIKNLKMPSSEAEGTICFGMKFINGKVAKTFNITRDAVYKDKKEYEEGIRLNLTNMQSGGAKLISHQSIVTNRKLHFDYVIVNMWNTTFAQYYTALPNGLMICAAIDIKQTKDADDIFLFEVMSSLEMQQKSA